MPLLFLTFTHRALLDRRQTFVAPHFRYRQVFVDGFYGWLCNNFYIRKLLQLFQDIVVDSESEGRVRRVMAAILEWQDGNRLVNSRRYVNQHIENGPDRGQRREQHVVLSLQQFFQRVAGVARRRPDDSLTGDVVEPADDQRQRQADEGCVPDISQRPAPQIACFDGQSGYFDGYPGDGDVKKRYDENALALEFQEKVPNS